MRKPENAMYKTILVVDDEERIVSLLKAYLSNEGFRVVTARNGHEALFMARDEKPDLILLDIMMPEMDGYEFIRCACEECTRQDRRRSASAPLH
jgi:DNA-binding response OmpR family regulator